jgi:hypothetical protein
MIKIAGAPPVKPRVPITAWVVAGLMTLFSLASSLMHTAPNSAVQDQGMQLRHYARVN